ncbi:hypothetical protein Kkor_1354 [Kangiella koreensis DSM 16069]|uniref:Uncharacterized protein n=1 Tax=Kangiella koreensis (strain DSM 16069 / JCM 12317 / KCTC 12182 / SW-125) TaxID=523791 RepID=C7RBX5_KANKD|nr:hypothetical protein Kkor_1354 [Kangiella koreensis DSM 16069]
MVVIEQDSELIVLTLQKKGQTHRSAPTKKALISSFSFVV